MAVPEWNVFGQMASVARMKNATLRLEFMKVRSVVDYRGRGVTAKIIVN